MAEPKEIVEAILQIVEERGMINLTKTREELKKRGISLTRQKLLGYLECLTGLGILVGGKFTNQYVVALKRGEKVSIKEIIESKRKGWVKNDEKMGMDS